ncbi:phosphoribosylglycinamide formyltransferase [Rhizobium sp. LjRoot254]|uniref:phosphoribosylglycinamide formyltransferase n=1 Tax=Rhizobium sp. LjRoot254 TaxID=3342297 RepID=UPI003ED000C9
MTSPRKRAAIMISGGGSNMAALIAASREPGYPVEFVGVVSDHANAGGLVKAEAADVPAIAFERKDFPSKAAHEAAILAHLASLDLDLICLAGYMRLLSPDFINAWRNRIINIHPSLLPLYPGLHTHQRAIDAGAKLAGCSVHFVTEGVDEGPVVAQAAVPVLTGDTAETLAARILKVEHKLYALALRKVADGTTTTDEMAQVISLG